jgi:hypothetical protein
MKMELFINVILRIFATFAASGLSVVGAGAIAGVSMSDAIFMAGIAGVATVVEGLSRAFLDDGKLTVNEINAVFSRFDKKGAVSDSETTEETSTRKSRKNSSIADA